MGFQDEDEVVISGIGGKFPEAEDVAELAEKLLKGESLMTMDERILTKGFYESLPDYHGKAKNNSVLFDNTFFGISTIVAAAMDPLSCQILQRTFEAVIDAGRVGQFFSTLLPGINPSELKGTNASVYSGTCHSDSDIEWATDTRAGYGIMGRNRCMNSNRVSYWLDLNGTSVSTDSGWTNGLSNLFHGWNAIKSGKCDTAIVSTANLQCHALITIQLKDFGCLSPDGISRPFDDAANGSGRSSAVVVFVLQRASLARRCYATIGHILSTCFGDREDVISKPSQKEWEALFREFYEKSKIDINDVHYIEAHGSSIREEDAEELNAIAEVFCKERKSPLLVGCVKSNMGNTEASSSFCGIVKAIISLERGIIPKNLNYNNPNSLCPALAKGQIKVVDKNMTFPSDGWIAVNSHSFGGTYAHIVLKANPKKKTIKYDNIPRLVLLADRTNDYMGDLIEKVESAPFDLEFIRLLHEIHSKRVEKYLGRGYTILPKLESSIHEHQAYDEEKRPIWFVFSGMGSQWPKMGKRLMDLPMFRDSIKKSHRILEEKGLDLIKIITTDDPTIFDNILHSFVGIAAIQVALVDILRELKITPDGLIGHSVGELGCAYADDCFTAEQMVLAAYYRGKASTETELIKGSMAAVGKGYHDIKDQLPDGIEVACHNSDDSCTLSGPVDLIHKFVAELKDKGVFAKSVNVSNIAYHSRYIKPAAPKLLQYLKQVVTDPKPRSSKWISTSNPESTWNTDLAKYCSAEYHTNNLLNSVLFEEGSKHIPKNAICIEIAPHGLLQAILKRSLGENVTNIPLTSRSTEDPLIFLFQSLGKMYMAGINPCIINLYPKIEYPVSRGTPVLHNLVHWHEQKAAVVVTPMEKKVVYSFKNLLVAVADDGTGYIANNLNIYPISIFLNLAWEIFASFQKKPKEECPVVFRDFRIDFPLPVHLSEDDNGTIAFQAGSGNFEIFTDRFLAKGNISLLKEKPLEDDGRTTDKGDLVGDEIYEEIMRKGYGVGESFRTLIAVSLREEELLGEIPSTVNWAQSIESLIQLHILQSEDNLDFIPFPCAFETLEIASLVHDEYKNSLGESSTMTASYDLITNTVVCGGIKIRGLKASGIPKIEKNLKFECTNFLPFMNPYLENSLRFANFCFGVLLDNINAIKKVTVINVLEVAEEQQDLFMGRHLQQLFHEYKVKVKTVSSTNSQPEKEIYDFIISPESCLTKFSNQLVEGGFILLRTTSKKEAPTGWNLIGKFAEGREDEYWLLNKIKRSAEESEFIAITGSQTQLINTLRDFKSIEKNVYLVGYKEPSEGIESFKKRMQAETFVPLRWIFILDKNAPLFDSKQPFYGEQLKKGLTTNVYNKGAWGGFFLYNFSESVFHDDVNFSLEFSSEIKPTYAAFDLCENLLKLQQIEYSGMLNNKKIMGITKLKNHKQIVVDKHLTWEIPEDWSLEDGATVPLSYALAYYCLVIVGKVKPNERVMVTDGMTSIGRASIALALAMSSRVFVTVNNEEEAARIKKLFPQLREGDIMSHADPKFDVVWKLAVKNDYAELIINMLDGERFFSVLNCTGQFGRIFHFGKDNMEKNKQLGSSIFLMSLALYAKSLDVITKMSEENKKEMHELIAKGIKTGIVKPFPRTILTFNELKKIQSKVVESQKQIKTLLAVDTVKSNLSYIRFDTKSSYLIIGDETDIWVDIAEWLINRSVQNVVVGRRDRTKRSQLRIPRLKKHKNVIIFDHQEVKCLLEEVKKLGPVAAVYYISMKSAGENPVLAKLDSIFRDSSSHFVAITKTQGFISELCRNRNEAGFPSTNFVWNTDDTIINQNLEFMAKVNGKDPVVHVSPLPELSTSERRLGDLLPSSIDDFCDLGESLDKEVRITTLQTMTGVNRETNKEITPLLFIPGLHKDPVKIIQPIVSTFIYPAACVHIPDIKLSIPKMASFILPAIIKYNKGNIFNIVGISWGTNLAMELAKQLEEMNAIVGLILIEGPLLNAKDLVTRSLESDLIDLIKGYSKSSSVMVHNEILPEKTFAGELNKVLKVLNLPSEKEKHFTRAATFINNNLQGLINHDTNSIHIKGPLTVMVCGQHAFDEKIIWKISKSVSIRYLPLSIEKLLGSTTLWRIIHGSAVSHAMSKNTVHICSWPFLEEYMQQKKVLKLSDDFQPLNMKFSFSF